MIASVGIITGEFDVSAPLSDKHCEEYLWPAVKSQNINRIYNNTGAETVKQTTETQC